MLTPSSHSKLHSLEGLEGQRIVITCINQGKIVSEEGIFNGFSPRGICLGESQNALPELTWDLPFIGYDSVITSIENREGETVYDNTNEDVADFYNKNLPTYFAGADGDGIVKENNKKVNAILTDTFGDLFPPLEMVN